ncbi:AAA family ATPase [Ruminiclostridium herbifermentans]|uniref:AAA family ATPase n=1 Tax=Ruminiclostridium herbifermentans TaxID=2488810 RepID=A0A7H1VNE3_9FIRM|nr:AAA family ATPase [Ruminiclostridium herbifermentans]
MDNILPKLIRAGLEQDLKSFEVISITVANKLKKTNPQVAEEINSVLFNKNITNNAYRSIGLDNLPTDKKNNMNLVNIVEVQEIQEPILDNDVKKLYKRFLDEQIKANELLNIGVKPSNSILLYGEPGVGKTYSAKWFSYMLKKPLIVLDLSIVISSYMGETGANIKKVLDYAKNNNSILFLDEFDAIAKRRDDERELGEIKRIVNVLLKELEEWPIGSIIIAATNHPNLLDKAIWRRFDLKIELEIPKDELKKEIIIREFNNVRNISQSILDLFIESTPMINAAEIVRLCDDIKRESVLSNDDINVIIINKVVKYFENFNINQKKKLVEVLYDGGKRYRVSEISKIFSIPQSTIYRYLKNNQ